MKDLPASRLPLYDAADKDYPRRLAVALVEWYRLNAPSRPAYYIPTCSGAPTDAPTPRAETVEMRFDIVNNNLYVYTNGAWKKTTTFS